MPLAALAVLIATLTFHTQPLQAYCNRGWHGFPVKGKVVNMLGFMCQAISAITTPLCCCSAKAAVRQYVNEWT